MGSQNKGIKIQKNNGFTEWRYYNIEEQWVHRIEVYRKTTGSQNRDIITWKNKGFTEQRYYNIEK